MWYSEDFAKPIRFFFFISYITHILLRNNTIISKRRLTRAYILLGRMSEHLNERKLGPLFHGNVNADAVVCCFCSRTLFLCHQMSLIHFRNSESYCSRIVVVVMATGVVISHNFFHVASTLNRSDAYHNHQFNSVCVCAMMKIASTWTMIENENYCEFYLEMDHEPSAALFLEQKRQYESGIELRIC